MELKLIEEIKDWFNSTDLNELYFKNKEIKIGLTKKGAHLEDLKINSNLKPIIAKEVGIFSFSKKGKKITLKKGDSIKKGDVLGYIHLPSKVVEVKSEFDGIIRLIAVNDESLVEYGQLLFVIE